MTPVLFHLLALRVSQLPSVLFYVLVLLVGVAVLLPRRAVLTLVPHHLGMHGHGVNAVDAVANTCPQAEAGVADYYCVRRTATLQLLTFVTKEYALSPRQLSKYPIHLIADVEFSCALGTELSI